MPFITVVKVRQTEPSTVKIVENKPENFSTIMRITVICATHRPKNQTTAVVQLYAKLLKEAGLEVSLLSMQELPGDFLVSDTFGNRTDVTDALLAEKIRPVKKLIIISPEYNGSYPGIFKAFLDGVEPTIWRGKKVALVGVAAGRAGNLRGMDHLTGVLHYLKMEVFSQKIPISQLNNLLNEESTISDVDTEAVLREQLEGFLKF